MIFNKVTYISLLGTVLCFGFYSINKNQELLGYSFACLLVLIGSLIFDFINYKLNLFEEDKDGYVRIAK